MSGTEQFFFLVVVPAAIVAVVWTLASLGGPRAQKRYRPGRPFQFTPVWYVANHRHGPRTEAVAAYAAAQPELTATEQAPAEVQARQPRTGGASDRW